MTERAAWLAGVALALAAGSLHAATLTIGVISRTDDERLDPRRVEYGYLGQPGGPITDAVDVALKESDYDLDTAKLQVKIDAVDVADAAATKAALQKFEKSGAAAVLLDLPAEWIAASASAVKLPLINTGDAADSLRASCAPNLFHTLPSERMRSDALAQTLVSRHWQKVLVLTGPTPEDATRSAVAQASMKRYAMKTVATKPFKLSSDPRERDLGNPLLLTSGADYDAIWVVDSDGEFARSLPYRTQLPRPVVGDGGLFALGWAPHFEQFGAPQLIRRFQKAAHRDMTAQDWAAWMATKAVIQAALEVPAGPSAAQVTKALTRPDFVLDGVKGVRVSFRAWDRQLRQPMLLTDGKGVITIAPAEGVLHPKNVLDTLGTDEAESKCKGP
jgi:ABC transporter substrate binding protein (PQQ-dependent alcohol dehydrogenase system)